MLRIFKQYYPIRNLFFVLGEGIFIYFSVFFASWIVPQADSIYIDTYIALKIILVTITCQTFLYYNDLYDLTITDSLPELCIRLMQALGASALFLAVVYTVFPSTMIRTGVFAFSVVITAILIVSWRIGYMFMLKRGVLDKNIILIGSGDLAQEIIDEISDRKDCGYSILFVIREADTEKDKLFPDKTGKEVSSRVGYQDLSRLSKSMGINIIVVALSDRRGSFPTEELLECRVKGIDVIDGVSFYEMLTGKLLVEQIKPSWLIFSEGFKKSMTRRFLKRLIDLIISTLLIILLLPLVLLTSILIKIDSTGPVIFSQDRVGQKKNIYKLYKFRSMVADAEKISGPVWAKTDDDRITRIGRLIRKTRIDEIPQLWNVLKGEMSFVGPRPEREFFVNKLEEMIPYYQERFTVKPGLTGWAQVSYRYGASVDDAIHKLNYDLFYIKNMSIFMDLMIVAKTIKIVFFGKGAR